jgi:hypothetical protein
VCCTKVHCRPEIVVHILQNVRNVTVNLNFYSYIYLNIRLYIYIYIFHHTCILWIPINLCGNPVGQPSNLWQPPSHLWCSIGECINNGGAKFSVGFITIPTTLSFTIPPQAEIPTTLSFTIHRRLKYLPLCLSIFPAGWNAVTTWFIVWLMSCLSCTQTLTSKRSPVEHLFVSASVNAAVTWMLARAALSKIHCHTGLPSHVKPCQV